VKMMMKGNNKFFDKKPYSPSKHIYFQE